MHMHVDQSGHHEATSGVDGLHRTVGRCNLALWAHRYDFAPVDCNRATLDESHALSHHREEVAAANQEVVHRCSLLGLIASLNSAGSVSVARNDIPSMPEHPGNTKKDRYKMYRSFSLVAGGGFEPPTFGL